MNLLKALIIFSSLSFLGYGIAYFTSGKLKGELKKFGLEKAGSLIAVLELLGSLGLIVGLKFQLILLVSAGGLAILMLLGVLVRIKAKDTFRDTLPALFYLVINTYIFFISLHP